MDKDNCQALVEQVVSASAGASSFLIRGHGSKPLPNYKPSPLLLNTHTHRGIVDYTPNELVLTARAGTPLSEITQALNEHRQIIPFEPPQYNNQGTLGGAIACGLSGPGGIFYGSVRDNITGLQCINGRGELLRFGGKVIKNVAGFDVSRLMVGAWGTMGLITEVSIRVKPAPRNTLTLAFECSTQEALTHMVRLSSQHLPITATAWFDNTLYLRLSGHEQQLTSTHKRLGGAAIEHCTIWQDIQNHHLDFYNTTDSLWRIILPPATPHLSLKGETLLEWNGGCRWLKGNSSASEVREEAVKWGGHAHYFRGNDTQTNPFHPLDPTKLYLHRKIKSSFDPNNIFNTNLMFTTSQDEN